MTSIIEEIESNRISIDEDNSTANVERFVSTIRCNTLQSSQQNVHEPLVKDYSNEWELIERSGCNSTFDLSLIYRIS